MDLFHFSFGTREDKLFLALFNSCGDLRHGHAHAKSQREEDKP